MNFAGLVFHLNDSLCVKLFPAGMHNQINWYETAFSSDGFDFYIFKDSENKKSYVEYEKDEEFNIMPLHLKETIRYKCVISDNANPCFSDFNPHLKNESNKFLKIERDDNQSITFQFINYLGKSEIAFNSSAGEHTFSFEIVPDKISHKEDYVNLTSAIAEECSALLLDYASPTSLSFTQDFQKQHETALEQFIFLRQFCYEENLESLFASIKRNSDRILVKEEELKPFGTGVISQKFFTNPFSHARAWNDLGNGVYLPSEISAIHKYDSLDTPANRFIKFALNSFYEICESIEKNVEKSSVYYDEAAKVKSYISDILNDSFFDDVQDLTVMPVNNQVLEKREGYAQISKAFSMVDLALQLDWKGKEDVYAGEAKNTALLYEYWLVFKLLGILKNLGAEFDFDIKKEAKENRLISLENGLLISLKEGKTSLVSALLKDKNLKINFYYNRTFSKKEFDGTDYQGSYSRDFRPDYTISIFPAVYDEKQAVMAGEASFIHFDAKYRVTDITSLFGKDSQQDEDFDAEKKAETVNTYNRGDLLKMHTYNDAIRKTIGSYVLYPGTSDEANTFSVYDELLPGVGAFAIRPGDKDRAGEKQIEAFLKDVILFKSHVSSRQYRKDFFDNIVIKSPRSSSEKENVLRYEQKKSEYVMCGMLRTEYVEYLEENHFLPTGADDTDYKLCDSEKELYFYYHAIRQNFVYALHPNIFKANYFCGSRKDFGKERIIKLEDWTADIAKSELVSAEQLQARLKENSGYNHENPLANFYYLVTLKNIRWHGLEIAGTEYHVNQNVGNLAASPYSPKIIPLRPTPLA